MNLPRLVIVPVLLTLAVSAVALTYPGGLSAACNDFQGFQRNVREMDSARVRDEALTDRSAILHDRLHAKQAIVTDVIRERMELAEAARQFLALTASDSQAHQFIQHRYTGSTDLERYARNVMDQVIVQTPAADRPAITQRLNRQFRAHFGYRG